MTEVTFMRTDAAGHPLVFEPRLIKAEQTEAIDGAFTLELTALGAVDVTKYDHLLYMDDGGRRRDVVVISPEITHDSSGVRTSIVCHDAIATNGSQLMLYDVRCRALSAQQCLEKALAKGDVTNVVYTADSTADAAAVKTVTIGYYHQSEWASVTALSAQTGLEVQRSYEFTSTNGIIRAIGHVGLYKAVGRANIPEADTTPAIRRFDYGYDLANVSRTITADTIATCMYGFGKSLETDAGGYSRKLTFEAINGGKPYVKADAATLAAWGIATANGGTHTRDAIYENADCADPNQLLRETKAALAAAIAPKVSYTVEPAALGGGPVYLGETVQVVDHQLGLAAEARVSKRVTDLLSGRSTITLGVTTNSLTATAQSSSSMAASTAGMAVELAQSTVATQADITPTVERVKDSGDSWDAGAALADVITLSNGLPEIVYDGKKYTFDPKTGTFKEA